MSETATEAPRRRPRHPWVVGLLALLWNAMGALDHVLTQTLHEAGMVAGAVHDFALSNGAEMCYRLAAELPDRRSAR